MMNIQRLFAHKSSAAVVLAMLTITQTALAAGTCVDIQNVSDRNSDQSKWLLTNSCREAIELSVRSEGKGRNVCAVMHIEGGASRTFTQNKVCGNMNGLITGCNCERSFSTVERRTE